MPEQLKLSAQHKPRFFEKKISTPATSTSKDIKKSPDSIMEQLFVGTWNAIKPENQGKEIMKVYDRYFQPKYATKEDELAAKKLRPKVEKIVGLTALGIEAGIVTFGIVKGYQSLRNMSIATSVKLQKSDRIRSPTKQTTAASVPIAVVEPDIVVFEKRHVPKFAEAILLGFAGIGAREISSTTNQRDQTRFKSRLQILENLLHQVFSYAPSELAENWVLEADKEADSGMKNVYRMWAIDSQLQMLDPNTARVPKGSTRLKFAALEQLIHDAGYPGFDQMNLSQWKKMPKYIVKDRV